MGAAERQEVSTRMKEYWAKRRQAAMFNVIAHIASFPHGKADGASSQNMCFQNDSTDIRFPRFASAALVAPKLVVRINQNLRYKLKCLIFNGSRVS